MAHSSISPAVLARELLDAAQALGFDLAAILSLPRPIAEAGTPGPTPVSASTAARYQAWLDQGFHADMSYLSRPDAVANRLHPEAFLPGLRSILVVGMNYHQEAVSPALADDPSRGLIADYARGRDYHAILMAKLEHLVDTAQSLAKHAMDHRLCVDTSPVLERDLATQAGLGFLGKNTCLINPRFGSWLFLGELFLTLDLPPATHPLGRRGLGGTMPSCGRCTRCIQACPTGALVSPNVLDSRRCISYLTIELKGPVPRALRPLIGNRIFGCDICQEVCPWNRRLSRPSGEPAFAARPESTAPRLLELLSLDDVAFAVRFGDGPLRRARRRGLLRNAAIALGNWGSPEAFPVLHKALHDAEPLVRGHAAWALGRVSAAGARTALQAALAREQDPWTMTEIRLALADVA